MNKIAKRIFALILVAALACSLFVALAACNKKDDAIDYSSLDGEISAEMQALMDRAEHFIERGLAYIIEKNVEDENRTNQLIVYSYMDNNMLGWEQYGKMLQVALLGDDGDRGIFYFESDEEAAKFVYENEAISWSDDIVLEGDIMIINKAIYEEILNCEAKFGATKNVSSRQFDYMKNHMFAPVTDSMDYKCNSCTFNGDLNGLVIESASYWGNDEFALVEGIYPLDEGEEIFEDDRQFLSINYTADSFIKTYEDESLIEVRLKDKPGWEIRRDDQHEGKYELYYQWDGKPIKELTVPAQVEEFDIIYVDISIPELDLDVLTIEEGMTGAIEFWGRAKTVNLPKAYGKSIYAMGGGFMNSHNRVGFMMPYNTALEVINFNGIESEFSLAYSMYYYSITIPKDYDSDEHVSIAVTVNFNDGTSKVYGESAA